MSTKYLLANFGFDTAEYEPCKVCPLAVHRSLTIITEPPGLSSGRGVSPVPEECGPLSRGVSPVPEESGPLSRGVSKE